MTHDGTKEGTNEGTTGGGNEGARGAIGSPIDSARGGAPIGPERAEVDQRLIAPPERAIGTAWAATYPSDPLSNRGGAAGGVPMGAGSGGGWGRGSEKDLGRPDPGTPKRAVWAWVVFGLSLLAVAVMQQLGAAEEAPTASEKALTPAQRVAPPSMQDSFDISARLFVKIAYSGGQVKESDKETLRGQIVSAARTPEDKFRAAVVVAEALGKFEAANEELENLERANRRVIEKREENINERARREETTTEDGVELPKGTVSNTPDSETIRRYGHTLDELGLELDIALARKVWTQGAESLSAGEAQRLIERHGWYGTLLKTHGEPFTQGARAEMVANAPWVAVLMVVAVVVLLVAVMGGLIAAVVMGVLVAKGKITDHFRTPRPGGSVYLETVAVFVFGFLVLKLVVVPLLALALGRGSPILPGAALAAQWLLLPIVFWPMLRGVSWKQWREDVGIAPVGGRSVVREIGAGIFGYFAALPLLGLAMGITVLIVLGKALLAEEGMEGLGGGPPPPSNPIADMVSQAPLWQLMMLFALATVWAPLVEECIFRGCLYRHLRGRLGVVVSALLSAGAFAFMHGYAVLLLLPVFTIGVIFGVMREWRGSIISAITAHALHNGTVLTLVGMLFMILRG